MTCSSSSSSRDELSKWSVIDNTANPPHSDQNDIDLPARIHAASRSTHHTLHHAVVGRLPLALPPQTNSPHLYALGISRFARIYSAFENAWRDFLNTSSADLSAKDQVRYHALLSHAYVPAITRSQRLASDLANLRAEWGDDVGGTEENDAAVWDAVRHISETCVKKPYVLLAYSWIMYMALFNGGRWIRDQLLNAGPQFWLREEDADKPDSLIGFSFLSFWSFDGTEDGEDIKRAFRARFVEASHKFLTENECDDVIHEAKVLFQHCLNIVSEIDVAVALERKKRDDKSRRANYGLGVSDRHALLIIITLGVSLAMAVSYYGRLMT